MKTKKALIPAEYNTLFLRGVKILKPILEEGKIKSLKHINSTVWYKILTEPRYFSDIEEVCQYMLFASFSGTQMSAQLSQPLETLIMSKEEREVDILV